METEANDVIETFPIIIETNSEQETHELGVKMGKE